MAFCNCHFAHTTNYLPQYIWSLSISKNVGIYSYVIFINNTLSNTSLTLNLENLHMCKTKESVAENSNFLKEQDIV